MLFVALRQLQLFRYHVKLCITFTHTKLRFNGDCVGSRRDSNAAHSRCCVKSSGVTMLAHSDTCVPQSTKTPHTLIFCTATKQQSMRLDTFLTRASTSRPCHRPTARWSTCQHRINAPMSWRIIVRVIAHVMESLSPPARASPQFLRPKGCSAASGMEPPLSRQRPCSLASHPCQPQPN